MKRALLTLLTDLSPAALRAVAEAWDAPLRKRTHADNVALLFAAMTDRWVFDDVFDVLPDPARTLLATLVAQFPDGAPQDAIASLHGDDAAAFAESLAPLTVALLVTRGADGSLSVPRELATLVTRAVRERQGEGESPPSLARALAALDLDLLADAARRWGTPAVIGSGRPGERERLIAELRRRTASARTLVAVEEGLSEPARRVVAALREYTDPLPLDEAMARAGVATASARHALLRDLTTSLLARQVWVARRRALAMPAPFRVPGTAALPPLVAVAATPTGAWRHPHALAWDMLTFLRLIERETIGAATGGLAALGENYALAQALAPQFWVGRDSPHPPAAALAFLATLARERGLIVSDDRALALADPVAWAKEEFAAQMRALFGTWRALNAWPEGRGTSLALWGVHWPTFRARLLDTLAACGPDQWHTLDNLLARLVAVRPALLGEGFTAAGAVGQAPLDRDLLTRQCAEATLRTALTWFGVIAWGAAADGQAVLHLTETGRWLLERGPAPLLAAAPGPPLAIDPDADAQIAVRRAESHHLWPLLAFAEAQTLDRIARYRMTAGTLRRALRRGLTAAQITRFLTQRVGGHLPNEIAALLATAAATLRRVTVAPAMLLSTDDPAMRPELIAILRDAGAEVEPMPDGRLLVRHPGGEAAILPALVAADFAPSADPIAPP